MAVPYIPGRQVKNVAFSHFYNIKKTQQIKKVTPVKVPVMQYNTSVVRVIKSEMCCSHTFTGVANKDV